MNKDLFEFCLRMGDNNLILGHRLSEWCGHGPVLEQDIALINVALDLVGQATNYLEYAAELSDGKYTADDLAYIRDVQDYRNALLVEQPNGDFGYTIARQYLYDLWHYSILKEMIKSQDPRLAGLSEKSLKEVTYHLRHSSEWVLRLGDGTDESREKIQNAFNDLWIFIDDLFSVTPQDSNLIEKKIIPDMSLLKDNYLKTLSEILIKSTLAIPQYSFMQKGSRNGKHSEHLGYLLAEMQFLPRAYPGASW